MTMIRKRRLMVVIPLLVAGALCVPCGIPQSSGKPLYRDASQPIEKRVEDLLGRMTLLEKVGQMNMPCVYKPALGKTVAEKQEGCRKFAAGTLAPGFGPGGGFFTLANEALPEGPRQQAPYFNEIQKIAIERTRLGIPLLESEEGTHGLMCSGGTVFPEGLAVGSTWNMDLVREIYTVAAREARAVGIHQLFTLVVEPNRDPRMGRNEEGFSEDPYMCARIAREIVRGAQGNNVAAPDRVVAGLCHYPGQSQPTGGYERGAMEISERGMRTVFLVPWVEGIKNTGALGVMATYPAIDDVPTHSSDRILTTLLRDELGFQGLVLSEGLGISTVETERIAPGPKEAGQWALKAGVDVGISFEAAYMNLLIESVQEGKAPTELIDRAVRRILTQKYRLGLFERPYVDVERAASGLPRDRHRELALEVAREGIVLLKNDGNLLPLDKSLKSIAVIGPNADDQRNQLGDYTPKVILQEVVTVLAGVRRKVPNAKVTYVKGCDVLDPEPNQIAEAQKAAREADVAIVVLGERHMGTPRATDGEGSDVASLDLTGRQEELIEAVAAAGKPTVLVLSNGRPLSIRWAAEHVPAIVEAWNSGERGGDAVADVLFGDCNPSGRLPITVPRSVGQLPMYYNYRSSNGRLARSRYVDMPGTPLYPFGYGLSYTQFKYSDLRIEPRQIRPDGETKVSVTVTNTGKRAGAEVAQLYIRDVLSTVTRPVKELRGFQKVFLQPGESKTVELKLGFDDLKLLDRNMHWVVEPGQFQIMVGASSQDVRLTQMLEVK
jgi:beta-glucosidase